MPAYKKHHGAAVSYAQAILDLANEKQQAESIGQELADIGQIIDATPSFGTFLSDPAIGGEEHKQLLDRVLGGKVSPLIHNTIGVLTHKGRLAIFRAVIDAYRDLLDEQLGKIEVDVIVAQKLDPDALEIVRQKVSAALKKDVVIHQYVDEKIIGGLILRVQDKLLDASVKTQLQALKRKLMSAAPRA